MKLNKEQYRAAVHLGGPMLVLAGPGSGKTHLLVERIRMMIEDSHVDPNHILVITFSRKAARQMQARFERLVQNRSYPVTFGTFHAVFFHILQEHYRDSYNLMTEEDQRRLIEDLRYSVDPFDDDTVTEDIIGLISAYKNLHEDMFSRNTLAKNMTEYEREEFKRFFDAYVNLCDKERLIDFDDMISKCRKLLYEHESVLRKWQRTYRYFLVDEFQDINDGQYDILRLLAGDDMNVFAVGDDDQSIYAFRGSRPELMKKFLRQYRGCKQVNLRLNYRCATSIIGAADTLIRNNPDRIERPMQRSLPSGPDGEVYVAQLESTKVQAVYVCDLIEQLLECHGYRLCEIAIIYRSDHCVRMFAKEARMRGILNDPGNRPAILTAHASKGLEYRCVIVISLQEGLFPHYKSLKGDAVFEERRLMYVAMTRAKERLYLCSVGTTHGKHASRFVTEAAHDKKYIADVIRVIRI